MSSSSFLLESDLPYFPVTFISEDDSVADLLSLREQHHHSSVFFVVVKNQESISSWENSSGVLVGKNIYQHSDRTPQDTSLKVAHLPLYPIVTVKNNELKNIFIILYKLIAFNVNYLVVIDQENHSILGVICQEHFQKYIEVDTQFNYDEIKQLVEQLSLSIKENNKPTLNLEPQNQLSISNRPILPTSKKEDNAVFSLYKILSKHREQEIYWQKLMEGAAAISGQDFLHKIAQYISTNFEVNYVFIEEKQGEYLQSLVFMVNGIIQDNIRFPVANTPCGKAIQFGIFTCQKNLKSLFPDNKLVADLEIEAFIGVPLINNQKDAIGNLSVASKSFIPKVKVEMITKILQIFATRIASELTREKAVTELKNLQKQLQNEILNKTCQLEVSEQKYRALIDNFPGVVYSCLNDDFWTMEFISEAIFNITGYHGEEVIKNKSIKYVDLIHPTDRALVSDSIQKSIENKEVFAVEYRLQHRNGDIYWVYEKGQGVYDLQGRLVSLCGAIIDVSDRKETEALLKEREQDLFKAKEMLELILNTIPQRVFWKDTQSKIIGCNQAFADDMNLSIPEVMGKHTLELCANANDAYKYQECDCEVINSGKALMGIQETFSRQDQSIMYIETNKFPLKDHQGEIIGILATYEDITDRREFERRLAEENNFNRQILENMAEGLCVCREIEDFPYIYFNVWNRKMEDITGYTIEEINEQGWYQSLYPDPQLREKAIERMKRMREGDNIYQEVWRIIRKDGQPRLIQISTCIIQKNNSIPHVLGLMQDVTEQKRAETALKQSENRYRKIVETANEGIWVINEKGKTTFVNQTLANMFRLSPDQMKDKDFYDFMDDSEKIIAEQLFQKRVQGVCEQHDFKFIRADGSTLWAIVSTSSILDKNGNFIGALGMLTDISDRKLIESHISTLSKRLQLAVESAQIGIWEWDLKTGDLTWDEQMYQLYDIPVGTPCNYDVWKSALHPDDLEDTVNLLQNSVQELEEYDTEFRVVHSDGKIIYIKANGLLEKDSENKPIKMIGVNYDITSQKEAERILKESNENLEKINVELGKTTRMKDEFLASMSHELRTPLNSILGMSEILKEQIFGTLNQKQLNSVNNIYRSGKHLLDLINDILDLAKIESGKTEFNFALVNVITLCRDSLNFIKYLAEKKNITLTFTNKIPSNYQYCQLDERRIRQALINLLNNAIKFTAEGGKVDFKIELVVKESIQKDSFLHFSVTDTGIGIATDNMDKLFQTFVQIDSSLNRQYAGTGLGLALVKRIIDAHGGFVTVESEINKGSCFSFYIPYSLKINQDYHSSFWHPQSPNRVNLFTEKNDFNYLETAHSFPDKKDFLNPELLDKMKIINESDSSIQEDTFTENNSDNNLILLVEDDEENIYAVADYLKIKGFSLEIARNGKDALDKLNKINPCLILMDIQMPEMDGFEAIKLIKNTPRWHNIPIIAITALAMIGDKEKCFAAGADDYLSKPFRLKDLIDKIKHLLYSVRE